MLDADAEPAQSMIVSAFIFCQEFWLGFLVWDIDTGMVILKPLVATVGIDVGRRRQRWSAPADLKIMNPSGRRFGDADDPAILCDNDFGFDRMAFLLAGIPTTLFSAWPLDRLFRAVDYQGLGLLTTDVDNARHPENPRGYSFDPPQGPADGRLVGLVQTGHKVLGDSASVQDQKNKKVILNSAHAPRTPGTVLRSFDPLSPMRPQTLNQLKERIWLNARQGAELLLVNKPRAVKLRHRKSLPCSSFFESYAG